MAQRRTVGPSFAARGLRGSGLSLTDGVDCDATCRAADGVYAVGECAEHRGTVYGIVGPIWEQCEVLADVLTGARPGARYRLASSMVSVRY